MSDARNAERRRLTEDATRAANWSRWGPYLSERQWGTVREDYSGSGACWDYFPHAHARSRAYRWGEDGLLGICDRECRLCFSLALWNERDPILKERLFGVSGPEGNHGEDVKECYYYLDATPTHSYAKSLYKYTQKEFPYQALIVENQRRGRLEREFELADTGAFDGDAYFDVFVEYAKAAPDDVLMRIAAFNRGPRSAALHLLPTVWFRNTWSWGRVGEGYWPRPRLARDAARIVAEHASLGRFFFDADPSGAPGPLTWLFTENDTNFEAVFGVPNRSRYVKDAFHRAIVGGEPDAVNPDGHGTKVAAHRRALVEPGTAMEWRLRLRHESLAAGPAFGDTFDRVFAERRAEADVFYTQMLPAAAASEERAVARQAYAGLLWSKQFYHYVPRVWLEGDPSQPAPPEGRWRGRNADWLHLYNRDIVSMPDKWEYPWYAAWDLAFHTLPFAAIDPHFAKAQLVLMLREWYMHPNGQLPAYEFALGDVNPPVHAWAAWRVYKITGARGQRDRSFLSRVFMKLLLNFNWWVNRKDAEGRYLFAGGFLGLDNIGLFDRSRPLPGGGRLDQADGTAWMAFYALTMMMMALELAREEPAFEDMASKFFEHFVAITDAINTLGGTGLWNDDDGFYYDQLHVDARTVPLRIRSMVGLIPLFACEVLEDRDVERLPGFTKRFRWFLANRPDLARHVNRLDHASGGRHLLAIASRDRLTRVLRYVLDEKEFLSPFGVRGLSRAHAAQPCAVTIAGEEYRVSYDPGESTTALFGGNSNWRGPVWFPLNYLLVEALERYSHFFGDELRVECPTGSGRTMTLSGVAAELTERLTRLFLRGPDGRRPCHGDEARYARDPHWRDLVLFYEYFDGDTGRGTGASHQTGWTALVARCLEDLARRRAARAA